MSLATAFTLPALSLTRYLRALGHRADLRIVAESNDGEVVPCNDDYLASFLDQTLKQGPTIGLFWNAHALEMLTAFLSCGPLYGHARSFKVVADDSWGGRFTRQLYEATGIRLQQLHRHSAALRLEDLKDILSNKPHLVIAIDSHGPYGRLGTAAVRLCRAYDTVLPLSAWSSRRVILFPRIGMGCPLPGGRLSFGVGRPVAMGRQQTSAEQSLSALNASLQRIDCATRHILNSA